MFIRGFCCCFEEKFPLPHLCSQVFLLDRLQVASGKESYPAINQIEASLRSINGPVFHPFNIQAFALAKQTQPGSQDKQMGLGARRGRFLETALQSKLLKDLV